MAGGNRILHTMIRVLDLEKSLEFYCAHMGMKLLRKTEHPEGRFTLAFLGYGDESDNTVIELTHNWDRTEPYAMGEAFGHIAIGVTDIYKVCAELEKNGIEVPRKPGPMKHGSTILAFIRDPDGYMIEFIER
jgi:lactoylglutathione lyase